MPTCGGRLSCAVGTFKSFLFTLVLNGIVKIEFPSRTVSNKDIIEMIVLETEKQSTFSRDLKKTLKIGEVGLKANSSATRRWLARMRLQCKLRPELAKKSCHNLTPKITRLSIDCGQRLYGSGRARSRKPNCP